MNLFNLFAKLTLDSSQYDKGLDESSKRASSFSSKAGTAFKAASKAVAAVTAAVTVAAGALIKLATNSISFGDDIDKTSQKLGLSTDAYQKWTIAAQMAGTSIDTLQTSIRQLNTFYNNLSEGQGEALLTLQKLGIGYDEFMAMDNDERLQTIVEAFQDLEEGTEKTRLAQEVFGSRTYQELLPLLNQEKGSIDELFNSVEDLGIIMSGDMVKASAELADKISLMQAVFKSASAIIATDFYPEINALLDGLIALGTGAEGASEQISTAFIGIIEKVVDKLPQAIDWVVNFLMDIIHGIFSYLPQIASALIPLIFDIAGKIVDMLPDLVGIFFNLAVAIVDGLLNADWGTLIIKLLNTVFNIVFVKIPEFVENLYITLLNALERLFTAEGLADLGKFGIMLAQALVNGLVSGIESGINLVIAAVNGVLAGISAAWTWAGIPAIPEIGKITLPRVQWYAKGGILEDFLKNTGTVYAVAGESGAEIVAEGARGTGVANVEQIAEAVYVGNEKYGLKETIQNAVSAIVNGLASVLLNSAGYSDNNQEVVLKIGEKEFRGYIQNALDSELKSQGRKTIRTITSY